MRGIAASEDETRRAFFDFESSSSARASDGALRPRLPRDASEGPAPAEAAENAGAADNSVTPEAPAKAEPEREPDMGPAVVPASKADELPMREVPVAIDRLAPVDDSAY